MTLEEADAVITEYERLGWKLVELGEDAVGAVEQLGAQPIPPALAERRNADPRTVVQALRLRAQTTDAIKDSMADPSPLPGDDHPPESQN